MNRQSFIKCHLAGLFGLGHVFLCAAALPPARQENARWVELFAPDGPRQLPKIGTAASQRRCSSRCAPSAGLICWPPAGDAGDERRHALVRWCWSALRLGAAALAAPGQDGNASIQNAISTARQALAAVRDPDIGRACRHRSRNHDALALAAASVFIGVSLLYRWHARFFLGLAIALSAGYWIVGQGFGGVFSGRATDPGTAPLMILIASLLLARERNPKRSRCDRLVPQRADVLPTSPEA